MRKIENVSINDQLIKLAIPIEIKESEEMPDFNQCSEANQIPAMLFWMVQKQLEQLKQ